MNKNTIAKSTALYSAFLYTAPTYCNVAWPAAILGAGIISSIALITISIIIEAAILYKFLKNISVYKALLISIIGNAASALVGTIVMAIAMLGWHFAFDRFLGGTFNSVNTIATVVLMYAGSCLIELYTIKLIFRYKANQLWVPVLIGNLITYILVVIFKFPNSF